MERKGGERERAGRKRAEGGEEVTPEIGKAKDAVAYRSHAHMLCAHSARLAACQLPVRVRESVCVRGTHWLPERAPLKGMQAPLAQGDFVGYACNRPVTVTHRS